MMMRIKGFKMFFKMAVFVAVVAVVFWLLGAFAMREYLLTKFDLKRK